MSIPLHQKRRENEADDGNVRRWLEGHGIAWLPPRLLRGRVGAGPKRQKMLLSYAFHFDVRRWMLDVDVRGVRIYSVRE